ncbi:MAG: LamG domain-containing protein [Candidatus Taylorbacteria bacterium]|nr:LamG domain-containing protein [Candidatus Taylorbacteria bacterium]
MMTHSALRLAIGCLVAFVAGFGGVEAAAVSKPVSNLGLVGWWKFDEASGTVAHDFSGNGRNGTLSGSPAWIDGKRGEAILLDGTDDTFAVSNYAPLSPGTADYTISLWLRTTGPGDVLMTSGGGNAGTFTTGFGLVIPGGWQCSSNSKLFFNFANGTTRDTGFCSNSTVTSGTWRHVAIVVDRGVDVRFYIDGNLDNTIASSLAGSVDFTAFDSGTARWQNRLNGSIDDFRLYSRALTAAEVTTLYRYGQTTSKAVSNNGLVGWWRMDEGTSTIAHDFSGNGNNGTLTNMDASTDWVNGKRGKALDFDGSNDYIDAGASVSLSNNSPFSYSVWFKLSGSQQTRTLMGKHTDATGGASLGIDDSAANKLKFHLNSYASQRVNSTATFDDGRWHYAVGTWDGDILRLYVDGALDVSSDVANTLTFPAVNFQIGRWVGGSSQYFNGQIDEARVYSRALSASEVSELYRMNQTEVGGSQEDRMSSGLVGYWSFNGKDIDWRANKAWDRSGRSLHGSIVNMGTTTAPVTGKIGQALNFAGSTEYVEVPQPLASGSPFTISMWYYPNAINGSYEILYSGTDNIDLQLFFHQTTKALTTSIENLEIGAGFTLSASTINKWHHIVWTYDYSRRKVYVDGVLTADTADTTAITINDSAVRFGKLLNGLGYTLQGRLDEVRVYDRALSASEAKQLYMLGK